MNSKNHSSLQPIMDAGNLQTPHESEIDQIHNRQLAAKDTENGRLKIELETEKKTADKFLHDLQTQTRLAGNYMAKLFTAQALITELCDALESELPAEGRIYTAERAGTLIAKRSLLQRSRESTR